MFIQRTSRLIFIQAHFHITVVSMHFLCSYFCFQSPLLLLPVEETYSFVIVISKFY